MTTSHTTTDHGTIRRWAEARGGRPAMVERTESDGTDRAGAGAGDRDGGILRIDFAEPDAGLDEIGWDRFFRVLGDRGRAFVYQDETADGETSRFNRFVAR